MPIVEIKKKKNIEKSSSWVSESLIILYKFLSISVAESQSIVIEKTINHNFTIADIRRSYTLPCLYVGKPNSTLVTVQWYMGNTLLYYRQDEKGRSKMSGGNTAFFKDGQYSLIS